MLENQKESEMASLMGDTGVCSEDVNMNEAGKGQDLECNAESVSRGPHPLAECAVAACAPSNELEHPANPTDAYACASSPAILPSVPVPRYDSKCTRLNSFMQVTNLAWIS